MSNPGQAALGIIGGAIGFIYGGPTGAMWGFEIGVGAGSFIFPTQLPPGPRLKDLKAQTSELGAPIPIVYGTYAISGNVLWASDLKEHQHTQSQGGKGGAQQKYYTYTQSVAVGLCANVIEGILRIWANGKVIYDRRPQQPNETWRAFKARIAASDKLDSIMTVYKGLQTTPDPTIETFKGVGNVPAYLDLSYVVFTDMNLTDYANRMPSMQFEVYTSGSPDLGDFSNSVLYPWKNGSDPRLSVGSYTYDSAGTAINDTWATALAGCGVKDYIYAWSSSSYFDTVNPHFSYPLQQQFYGENVAAFVFLNVPSAPTITRLQAGNGDDGVGPFFFCDRIGSAYSYHWGGEIVQWRYLSTDPLWTSAILPDQSGLTPPPFYDEKRWTCTQIAIKRQPQAPPSAAGAGAVQISAIDALFFQATGEILRAQTWTYDTSHTYKVLAPYRQSGADYTGTVTQYPLNPCLRSDDPNYSSQIYWEQEYADAVALGYMPAGYTYNVEYPVVQSWAWVGASGPGAYDVNPVNVADIVADILQRSGITSANYDLSAISGTCDGYALTNVMPGRSALLPLMSFGLFEAVESQEKLKFVPRGGSVVATLTSDDLGAYLSTDQRPSAMKPQRAQDVDLPRLLWIKYASPALDYQAGQQSADRVTTTAFNTVTIDLPVSMQDQAALRLAEIQLYDAWRSRNSYSFILPLKSLLLEPTDCIEVPVDGVTQRVRIKKADFAWPSTLTMSACGDDPGVLTSYATVGSLFSYANSLLAAWLIGPTDFVVLDIPAVRSQDNDAGFYVAGRGYLPAWKGYTVFRSWDGGSTWENLASTPDAATMGTLESSLDSTSTTLTVALQSGTFSSATTDQLAAGANLIAVGAQGRWELLQFDTATLSGGYWTLNVYARGLFGTSAHENSSGAEDRVVLMSAPGILRCPLAPSLVGKAQKIVAVSQGETVAESTPVDFTSSGASVQAGGLTFDSNGSLQADYIFQQVFGP